jgi:hypothetical protein
VRASSSNLHRFAAQVWLASRSCGTSPPSRNGALVVQLDPTITGGARSLSASSACATSVASASLYLEGGA